MLVNTDDIDKPLATLLVYWSAFFYFAWNKRETHVTLDYFVSDCVTKIIAKHEIMNKKWRAQEVVGDLYF
jgi:hypothetical protein